MFGTLGCLFLGMWLSVCVCVCLIYEVQNSLIDICVIVIREKNHISTGYHEWKGVAFAGSSEHFENKDHPDMVG